MGTTVSSHTPDAVDLGKTLAPRFSGHESFSLRYMWLPKAIQGLVKNPSLFADEEHAMVVLGVGKNMVRSIRHWGVITGMLAESPSDEGGRKKSVVPSPLGRKLFGKRGLDPYLEDPTSLWLVHWKLTSRPASPTTWYWLFNMYGELEFDRDGLLAGLQDIVVRNGWKASANTLKRDVDCCIRCYVPSEPDRRAPIEDTLDCPLAELGLIRETGDQTFAFERGEHTSLSAAAVALALTEYWAEVAPGARSMPFNNIAYSSGSPGRCFKLSESALTWRLEQLAKITDGILRFDVTAGIGQVYKTDDVSTEALLSACYAA